MNELLDLSAEWRLVELLKPTDRVRKQWIKTYRTIRFLARNADDYRLREKPEPQPAVAKISFRELMARRRR